jgi:hypothetical protein
MFAVPTFDRKRFGERTVPEVYKDPPIPTPPVKTAQPVDVDVDAVLEVTRKSLLVVTFPVPFGVSVKSSFVPDV